MFLAILPNFTEGNLLLSILFLIIGLVVIVKGGDFFVDASCWIAEVLHMPKFLIGATLVSIATTLPEMIVSIIAVSKADPNYAMSVGNAVGSVTANTGLILAISAIFVGGVIDRRDFGVKSILIILSSLVMFIFGLNGKFGYIPSVILFIILIYYMVEVALSAKKASKLEPEEQEEVKKDKKTCLINILKFVSGAAGIVIGADLLVNNSENIAHALHVSDGIIAITVVAIGTSLPELVTTITSIVKKQGDLGVGNVIGANIIDLTLILPICSFISNGNLIVTEQSRMLDMPALLIISLIAVVPALITKKFSKLQGILMLLLYIAYVVIAGVVFA